MLKQVLRQLLPNHKRHAPPSNDHALALIERDQFEEAEPVFRQLCIAQPDDAEARYLLGTPDIAAVTFQARWRR